MQQLFPASSELAKYHMLADGTINLNEQLKNISSNVENPNLQITVPERIVTIKWSEVRPPRMRADFAEGLLGSRLKSYYFQYLGQFSANDKIIAAAAWQHAGHAHPQPEEGKDCSEMFATDLPEGNAIRAFFGGTGFFNATWLLDFLMQPQRCLARGEKLSANKTKDGYAITLSTAHNKEVETYLFKSDFSAMQWSHITTIK